MITETLMRPVQRFKDDNGSSICWKCNLCHGAEVILNDGVRIPGRKCPLWNEIASTKWDTFEEWFEANKAKYWDISPAEYHKMKETWEAARN